jgi:hypothetical protein
MIFMAFVLCHCWSILISMRDNRSNRLHGRAGRRGRVSCSGGFFHFCIVRRCDWSGAGIKDRVPRDPFQGCGGLRPPRCCAEDVAALLAASISSLRGGRTQDYLRRPCQTSLPIARAISAVEEVEGAHAITRKRRNLPQVSWKCVPRALRHQAVRVSIGECLDSKIMAERVIMQLLTMQITNKTQKHL